MEEHNTPALIQYLSRFVSERRMERMHAVLNERTRYVTVVLEDISQSHNASAVLRSAECLGVQDVHIIENKNEYGTNKNVLKGSHKWLSLYRYNARGSNNTPTCFDYLCKQGYTILSADPTPDTPTIDEIDVDVEGKIAFVLGNELTGLTAYAKANTDKRVRIPMYGFTESYNVSVCGALGLKALTSRLRQSQVNWHLTETEGQLILLDWLRKSVRNADILEASYQPPKEP